MLMRGVATSRVLYKFRLKAWNILAQVGVWETCRQAGNSFSVTSRACEAVGVKFASNVDPCPPAAAASSCYSAPLPWGRPRSLFSTCFSFHFPVFHVFFFMCFFHFSICSFVHFPVPSTFFSIFYVFQSSPWQLSHSNNRQSTELGTRLAQSSELGRGERGARQRNDQVLEREKIKWEIRRQR